MNRVLTWGTALLLLPALGAASPEARGADDPSRGGPPAAATQVVVLLRHAEKAAEPADDPPLSPGGEARARELARILGPCSVDGLVATSTKRATGTLMPLAERFALEVQTFDIDDPYGMAQGIRESDRRFVVAVCHSDTVVRVLEGLGARLDPWPERIAYDDLFIVTLNPPKTTEVLHLKYGGPAR